MTKDEKISKADAPTTETKASPDLNISKGKVKKNKKKKHANKSATSVSSSSASEVGSVPPLAVDEPTKEQFYDAHESYHGLPDDATLITLKTTPADPPALAAPSVPAPLAAPANPVVHVSPAVAADPAIATTLLVTHSEHGQDLKLHPSPPSAGTIQSSRRAKKTTSTVSKPVTGPQ